MTAEPGRFSQRQLLCFMQDATSRILESTAKLSKTDFMEDSPAGRQVRDSVVYNIGVLGEAANDLAIHYPDFVLAHPEIPAKVIYRMRNQLFHGYHSINMEIVWSTCREVIPGFAEKIQACIAKAVDQ